MKGCVLDNAVLMPLVSNFEITVQTNTSPYTAMFDKSLFILIGFQIYLGGKILIYIDKFYTPFGACLVTGLFAKT